MLMSGAISLSEKGAAGGKIDVYLEEPPVPFHVLKGIDEIKSEFNSKEIYDVFFALGCNDERLGDALPMFRRAKRRVNIDHHISNRGSGDVNIVETEKSSTAELIYELMEPELIDEEIAKAIYLGMAHDTGVFRYSNTSPGRCRLRRNYSNLDLISRL